MEETVAIAAAAPTAHSERCFPVRDLPAANLPGLSWRPVFLLNAPFGLIALLAGLWLVPESRGTADRVDLVGMVLVAATLLLLLVPLSTKHEAG